MADKPDRNEVTAELRLEKILREYHPGKQGLEKLWAHCESVNKVIMMLEVMRDVARGNEVNRIQNMQIKPTSQ